MQIAPGSAPYVFFIGDHNAVVMVDFVNEANNTTIKTIHDSVQLLKVCPNGRYLLTAGDKGDINIYSIRRQRPEAEMPDLLGILGVRDGLVVTKK
jgi:WD40 repeat protein